MLGFKIDGFQTFLGKENYLTLVSKMNFQLDYPKNYTFLKDQSKFDGFNRTNRTNANGAFILKRQSLTIHDGCVDVKKIPIIIRVMFQVLSFFSRSISNEIFMSEKSKIWKAKQTCTGHLLVF